MNPWVGTGDKGDSIRSIQTGTGSATENWNSSIGWQTSYSGVSIAASFCGFRYVAVSTLIEPRSDSTGWGNSARLQNRSQRGSLDRRHWPSYSRNADISFRSRPIEPPIPAC